MAQPDPKRELLRHAAATLAYRCARALHGLTAEAASARLAEGSPSAVELMTRAGDVIEWAGRVADGQFSWKESEPRAWDAEVSRFFDALARLDERLASDEPLRTTEEKLLQGPIATAFTAISQILLLRDAGGTPISQEVYFSADIRVGHVGKSQAEALFLMERP